jgi:hypothetical protein
MFRRLSSWFASPTPEFLIIFGSLLTIILFDGAGLGMIGITQDMALFGSGIIVFFSLLLITLLTWWGKMNLQVAMILSVIVVFGMLALREGFIVIGWATGLMTFWIPPQGFLLALPLATIFFVIAKVIKLLANQYLWRSAAILVLFLTIVALFTMSAFYVESDVHATLYHDDHQYAIRIFYGWLGDPDALMLSECNIFGFQCERVWHSEAGSYSDKTIRLESDSTNNTVNVIVSGSTLYEHPQP